MTNSQKLYKKIFLASLFIIAFAERVAYDLGPNIELVTTAMILASFHFGKKETFWLIFAIIATTDIIIGNSNIFLFTWSGFLIPALASKSLINQLTNLQSSLIKLPKRVGNSIPLVSTGLVANLFFFLWTNFGVWILSTMYPKTALGLLSSYINAIPFLRMQALSTLVFVPLGFTLTEVAIYFVKNYRTARKLAASSRSMLQLVLSLPKDIPSKEKNAERS